MLRYAAAELAKDKQPERALQTLRDLIPSLTDSAELRKTYLSLADVAKSQTDRELELAALERVIDFDPADSGIRFRLAYLYNEMEKPSLSAYHYKLRTEQGLDDALNNLGVAYGRLKLPGKEIAALEKAGKDWLAKANLSHAYIDRGFLSQGETLANEVTKADCDETALNRATAALTRVSATRSEEDETEEKRLAAAQRERIFRSAYAEAFAGPARQTY